MGSFLGPTPPNIFLCYFEKDRILECPLEFLSRVYKRDVDDISVTFDSYPKLIKFVDYLNH